MRITIEPTTKEQLDGKENPSAQYPKIILEYPHDHMGVSTWLEIFALILINLGFDKERIADKLTIEEYTEDVEIAKPFPGSGDHVHKV